jgi:membrane-associated protease RseP (regulator of RpoE activity)
MKREGWYRVGFWRPFGAELWVHWTLVVLVVVSLGAAARDPLFLMWVIASYYLALVVHEAGHAWMARRLGCGITSLEFSPFHGRCCYWGRDTSAHEHFLIAAAGPLAQGALCALVFGLGAIPEVREFKPFGPVYVFAGWFNVFWTLMNLLPVRGLDGEVIWARIGEAWRERRAARKRRRDRPALRRVK